VKFAPSILAAEYTFGKGAVRRGCVSALNNAVDLDIYKFYPDERNRLRNQFGINNKLVVGHVGRFMEQKNHSFLIDVFCEIKKQNNEAVLLLVGGNGNLEERIRQKVAYLGLEAKPTKNLEILAKSDIERNLVEDVIAAKPVYLKDLY
jgi:glycosyltransferase involved in cell wall biosynthesis